MHRGINRESKLIWIHTLAPVIKTIPITFFITVSKNSLFPSCETAAAFQSVYLRPFSVPKGDCCGKGCCWYYCYYEGLLQEKPLKIKAEFSFVFVQYSTSLIRLSNELLPTPETWKTSLRTRRTRNVPNVLVFIALWFGLVGWLVCLCFFAMDFRFS